MSIDFDIKSVRSIILGENGSITTMATSAAAAAAVATVMKMLAESFCTSTATLLRLNV